MQKYDFGEISFTAALIGLYGHRACELGNLAFGKYNKKTGENLFPENNFIRFAIPRLRYEQQDLESAAVAVKILYDNRSSLKPIDVTYGERSRTKTF